MIYVPMHLRLSAVVAEMALQYATRLEETGLVSGGSLEPIRKPESDRVFFHHGRYRAKKESHGWRGRKSQRPKGEASIRHAFV